MNPNPQVNKTAAALSAQRFGMLEDIAAELTGELNFPTCFDVAIHLRNVLRKPDVSLREVAAVVLLEPLVCAKLLRLANSVAYRQAGKPIADVQMAISRLGVELARSTAYAVAIDQLLHSRDLVVFSEMSKGLWDHTLKAAAATRVLARRMTKLNADEAMTAGLLHDLGAFYMLYRASQYEELRIRPDTVKHLILQWHESIGEALLYALGLPENIIEAVREHDQPRKGVQQLKTLADLVYVGNQLAGGISMLYVEGQPQISPLFECKIDLALIEEIERDYQELMLSLA